MMDFICEMCNREFHHIQSHCLEVVFPRKETDKRYIDENIPPNVKLYFSLQKDLKIVFSVFSSFFLSLYRYIITST